MSRAYYRSPDLGGCRGFSPAPAPQGHWCSRLEVWESLGLVSMVIVPSSVIQSMNPLYGRAAEGVDLRAAGYPSPAYSSSSDYTAHRRSPPGPLDFALAVDVVGDAEQHRRPPLGRDLAGPALDWIALDEG